jgi:hypothetical protein
MRHALSTANDGEPENTNSHNLLLPVTLLLLDKDKQSQ